MAGKLRKGRSTALSNLDALKILRSKIDPKKKATEFDWELLADATQKYTALPPLGSITVKSVRDKFNIGTNAATRLLTAKVREGVLQSALFYSGIGGAHVRHWWPVSNKVGKK